VLWDKHHQSKRGGRGKKNDESDVHFPQLQKRKQLIIFSLICFYRVFGRFVTRGVQKHEKTFVFEKVHLGSSQKNAGFFSSIVFSSLGCFARFFLSRSWAFHGKGSSKTR
jgi:hypothetical protein